MLDSVEHEILNAHKYINIKKFGFFIGRFPEFRRFHNFANLFSKWSESTFYKEISKFQ